MMIYSIVHKLDLVFLSENRVCYTDAYHFIPGVKYHTGTESHTSYINILTARY